MKEVVLRNTNSDNLVNYINSSTALNCSSIAQTSSEESVAFLIKNNIFIEYRLGLQAENNVADNVEVSTETFIHTY